MLFLVAVLAACLLSLIEPSWERDLAKAVAIGFGCVIAWSVFDRLERIEDKLDAVLKKLSEH